MAEAVAQGTDPTNTSDGSGLKNGFDISGSATMSKRRKDIPMSDEGKTGVNDTQCHICRSNFRSGTLLQAHMAKHIFNVRLVRCKNCNRSFSGIKKCLAHAKKSHKICKGYTNKNSYVCILCGRRFACKLHCVNHMVRHRGMKLHCDSCGWMFGSLFGVRVHRDMWHWEDTVQNNPQFGCPLHKCLQMFDSLEDVAVHVKEVHKSYSCTQCGRLFKMEKKLNVHCTHHDQMIYKCQDVSCGWMFQEFVDLQRHCYNKHSAKISKNHESQYLVSQTNRTSKSQFLCKLCNRPFKRRTYFQDHLNHHSRMKYKCLDGCGHMYETFVRLRSHYYKAHKRGIKKESEIAYLIDVEGFSDFHCGENECKLTFQQFDQLQRHSLQAHEKSIPESVGPKLSAGKSRRCSICNRNFLKACLLEHHEATHDQMIYVCQEGCGHMFENIPQLRSHYQQHHKQRLKGMDIMSCVIPGEEEDAGRSTGSSKLSVPNNAPSSSQAVSLPPVGLGHGDNQNAMKYICQRCKKLFANFNFLQNHYFCDHSTELSVEDEPLCRIERIKLTDRV